MPGHARSLAAEARATLAALWEDAHRNDWTFRGLRSLPSLAANPSVRMMALIRLGTLARGAGPLPSLVRKWCRMRLVTRFSSDVSFKADIGAGLKCPHPVNIVIGEGCQVGRNVTLYHGTTLGRATAEVAAYPSVADDVTIYANASVLGAVSIGPSSVVGAHALVLDDVPPRHAAVGVPARPRALG